MVELLDKYRELYLLSKEASDKEIERIRRIEDKSAKLISLCALLIAFVGFAGKFVLDSFIPPHILYDWLCFISYSSFAAIIIYAFFNLLGTLKVINIYINPSNQEMITFFDHNSYIDVLYALAKNNNEAIAFNSMEYKKKLKKLKCSYWAIYCSMVFMVVFIISLVLGMYIKSKLGG